MTRNEVNEFTAILRRRLIELAPQLRKRDGIAIEKAHDAMDETQFAAERELVTRTLERESKVMRDVRAALQRVEEGIYGTCLHCEEEISLKRLKAVPWAALCIGCQELDDERGSHTPAPAWMSTRAA
jgi:DnaK suppressor protein